MGRLTNAMWRMLGAQTSRNQSQSLTMIEESAEHDEWAAGLGDGEFAGAAAELDMSVVGDRAKFLALVREAGDRKLDMKPFDVQLQGALRMLEGDVVEMATGEGKTLAGAIAAIGYALDGHQVHVVSVNDYLADRDAKWMKPLYDVFGISVASINEHSTREERQAAYDADVTYASVNEIGFDVLRDHLALHADELVAPEPDVVIVDEADSVLVDEALVPLILAGSTDAEIPNKAIHEVVSHLKSKHYELDQDGKNVSLTEEGAQFVESTLGGINLYDEEHVSSTLVHVNVALYAYYLLERDVDYIVRDGGVHLINASRGRVARLQRWPDGVQAAVEYKEGLNPTQAGEVIDTITVQALIGRYPRVAGMTGTAIAAGEQFRQFYDLQVSQIPPNAPNIRVDEPDRVYDTKAHKVEAVVEFVSEIHATGQPILIGTHDVAQSEELAYFLERAGVPSVVLNAKNDAEEAAIIAEAGRRSAVTVSTQMAGRGTDIRLGGSSGDEAAREEVIELGGLCVVGTGRYDTERLDNQLRGRAGRQGDPGRSVFFSSLEDPLVTKNLTHQREQQPISSDGSMGAKGVESVENAQKIAEGAMLQLHSNTWEYNKQVNEQRNAIVRRRMAVLTTDQALTDLKESEPERYESLSADVDDEVLAEAARQIVLYHLDRAWADHLAYIADVQASIHLRALGAQSPLEEFHKLIFAEFAKLADEAMEAARKTFVDARITADGVDLGLEGLHRSTMTWTYLVHENHFASAGAQAIQGIVGIFR
ncbi:accessory Sec system translocase SecA2 [Gordonia sp. PS3]|uniref:Protein translocase subunit SecA n=1 Tax=Gordonia sihwensis NBRC 108236 TaxID=1223544 RepID=L7LIA8_9ACTN|nr:MULTISPECIES: accessory Sec system translocase SecA2 [Gordonia]AUH68920.1 accessory Sec system translocase SecA2 [Gordonia sp. YC-JH1]KJR08593.1 preprotein translocase subunit SecA [Gordonia sihwensis]MBY4570782.1 accessory Sec system translocase SecA2 [Gordonia sihwensis]GAC59803.1 protein translocase subunit SecA [Gordonia sihwensis NBRC 108236]